MDPLSVSASVVGLLAAAAKVTASLHSCWSSLSSAPKLAQSLASEVSSISGCLTQVQAFLLQPADSQSSRSRTDLIMVDQVLVSFTDCVCVFSDLEKVVDSLLLNGSMRLIDRAKWMSKEKIVSAVLSRLQRAKLSLNLIITTLTCASQEEARSAVKQLVGVVQELLENNRNIAKRLESLESHYISSSRSLRDSRISESIHSKESDPLNHDSFSIKSAPYEDVEPEHLIITTTTNIDVAYGLEQAAGPATAFGYSFDDELQTSRVYSRTARKIAGSLNSKSACSLGWSFFSHLSLSKVSNMSVLGLLVSKEELYNSNHYTGSGYKDYEVKYSAPPRFSSPSIGLRREPSKSIILLGESRSGKTTIFRQCEIRQHGALSEIDRVTVRPLISCFLDEAVRKFIDAAREMHQNGYRRSWMREAYLSVEDIPSLLKYVSNKRGYNLDPERISEIRNTYHLDYFLSSFSHSSRPTDDDVLRVFTPSTGIYQSSFTVGKRAGRLTSAKPNNHHYHLVDVAGNLRKRHQLDDGKHSCIVVVVDVSDYENAERRLDEIRQLVREGPPLIPIILLLNKVDLLEARMPYNSISDFFPDYKGGKNFKMALNFFTDYFLSAEWNSFDAECKYPYPKSRLVHIRFMNALDSKDVDETIDHITDLLAQWSADTMQSKVNIGIASRYPQDYIPSRWANQLEWQRRIDKSMGSVRVNW